MYHRFGTAPTRLDLPSVQEIIKILAGDFALGDRVKRGFVFGSFARGEQRPDSDIDVLFEIAMIGDGNSGKLYEARLAATTGTWRGHTVDLYLTNDAERLIREVVCGPAVEMRRGDR